MKKHGSLSLAFVIPMIIVTLVIMGVFGYKLYSDMNATTAKASEVPKEMPRLNDAVTKPKRGYGEIIVPTKAPTPTPMPTSIPTSTVSVADLETELTATVDDGGTSLFNELASQSAGL